MTKRRIQLVKGTENKSADMTEKEGASKKTNLLENRFIFQRENNL